MKKIIAVLSAVVMLAVLLSGCSMLEKLNDTMRDLDGNSNIKTTSGEPTAKSTSQTSASAVPAVNTAESGVSYKYKADMKLGETTDAGTCAFKLDRLQESNFLSVLGGSAGFECSNQNALFLDGVFELTNNSGSTAKLGDIIAVQAGTETQSFSSAFFAVEKDGALKQGAELANGETAVVHCAVEVDKSLSGDITYGLVAGETYYNTIFKAGTITAPTDKKIEKGKSKYVNGSFQLDMAGALYEEKVSPGNNSYVTYNVSTEGDIFTVVKLDYSNLTDKKLNPSQIMTGAIFSGNTDYYKCLVVTQSDDGKNLSDSEMCEAGAKKTVYFMAETKPGEPKNGTLCVNINGATYYFSY